MARQKKATEAKPDKKGKPKTRPVIVAEPARSPANPVEQPDVQLSAAGGGSIQAQAVRLGDERLQSAQQRAMAAHIGQI